MKEPRENPERLRASDRERGTPGASANPGERTGSGVIRVEGDIAHKCGIIASIEGKTVSEIISPLLRPLIEQLFREALANATKLIETKPERGEDETGEV
jgi:hypothetical protein